MSFFYLSGSFINNIIRNIVLVENVSKFENGQRPISNLDLNPNLQNFGFNKYIGLHLTEFDKKV